MFQLDRGLFSGGRDAKSKSGDDLTKDLWSSMLSGVASGKRLPEKNVLILGGTSETQKELLEALCNVAPNAKRPPERQHDRPPPLANQFALGYTYHDVLDADQEDILARLSLYLLTDPSPSFSQLLKPLLTPQALPHTLAVVLLDWAHPWSWLRDLSNWVDLLRSLLESLNSESFEVMESVMKDWQGREHRERILDGSGESAITGGEVSIPLGPGEWDDALGIPLCVVCQNADKMQKLEKEEGWKEEDFDYVLQFLRTVLLKHGASLIYTSPNVPSSLQNLVHSSLGIQSLLKRSPLRHNVIDREKILIPPNWDSWGKIRILRDGFDVEGISKGWFIDVEGTPSAYQQTLVQNGHESPRRENGISNQRSASALAIYEETVLDPNAEAALPPGILSAKKNSHSPEVESLDTQEFLAEQVEVLENLKVEEERSPKPKSSKRIISAGNMPLRGAYQSADGATGAAAEDKGRLDEQIGPVQFNMGGIQVDADDILKRLKDREANRPTEGEAPAVGSPDGKAQNDALASFFAGLMKRGGGTAASSPKSSGL
ncbi:MAG: hypothetical protein M1827_004537 [Pycnora praestabilis]|nr:MAG: hypothetical protein M1827_004537 [Pycnora praestabilis]